jgi:hypothetical protein
MASEAKQVMKAALSCAFMDSTKRAMSEVKWIFIRRWMVGGLLGDRANTAVFATAANRVASMLPDIERSAGKQGLEPGSDAKA